MWKAAAAFLVAAATSGQAQEPRKVVVELFTSQGCNSCPPADELLAELAERDDVIALALHVDYWNYLGWRDTFSSPANTLRQRDYARALGERMIYTPQIVVNGVVGVIGSRRDAVRDAIAAARPMTVSVTIAPDGDMLRATAAADQPLAAEVVYIVYDATAIVAVTEGENRGRDMIAVNPVRLLTMLARFTGGEGTWTLPAPRDARGVVVLVQSTEDRRILGAARYEMALVK